MTPQLEALILIILGLLALLLGKRMFWMFAGIVGFALGWWLASRLLPPTTEILLRVLAGVIAGIIVSGLSRFLGGWAIRIVAAIAGLVILPMLLSSLKMLGGLPEMLWAVIGAALGFVFALFATNWTLILLSSVLGAGLILSGAQVFLSLSEGVRMIVGFILIIVGAVVQSR